MFQPPPEFEFVRLSRDLLFNLSREWVSCNDDLCFIGQETRDPSVIGKSRHCDFTLVN